MHGRGAEAPAAPPALGLPCEMSATMNPLYPAGKFLLEQVVRSSSERGFDALFAGTVEELSNRWAATAALEQPPSSLPPTVRAPAIRTVQRRTPRHRYDIF
eukprot:scaffold129008_cov105-Phaeocystis_antarctica.AAC.2